MFMASNVQYAFLIGKVFNEKHNRNTFAHSNNYYCPRELLLSRASSSVFDDGLLLLRDGRLENRHLQPALKLKSESCR